MFCLLTDSSILLSAKLLKSLISNVHTANVKKAFLAHLLSGLSRNRPLVSPCQGGSHVARLNFKTSRVSVHKCLSLIVGFAITVTIWPREVVSCRDFILSAVSTFWAMSLVGIYPGRASLVAKRSSQLFYSRAKSLPAAA